MAGSFEPKIIVFCCQWCSYAAADLAGSMRVRSCDEAMRNASGSAMGTSEEDFQFVVEDVLAEVKENQPGFENLQAPIDKQGARYFLNQNSREPLIEPEEMVPLWKILHLVGADWTYGSIGWGGENYCMFLADDQSWQKVTRQSAEQADRLGCKYYISTITAVAGVAGRSRHPIKKNALPMLN